MRMKRFIFAKEISQKFRKGFTLVEMAIALGVAAIVIGGVWTAGAIVWSNYKIYKVVQQSVEISHNLKDFYGVNALFATYPLGEITALADGQRLIPIDMRVNPNVAGGAINHALSVVAGGSFHLFKIADLAGVAQNDRIRMTLQGLSQQDCAKFLLQFPKLDPENGIVRFGTVATNAPINTADVINFGAAAGTWPLTTDNARLWCNNLLNNNTIQLEFKIRG